MCDCLCVSRSGFCAWQERPTHAVADRRLAVLVRAAHERGRKTYASPRVHAELGDEGERGGHGRAEGTVCEVRFGLIGAQGPGSLDATCEDLSFFHPVPFGT